jgi:hypothetical protein
MDKERDKKDQNHDENNGGIEFGGGSKVTDRIVKKSPPAQWRSNLFGYIIDVVVLLANIIVLVITVNTPENQRFTIYFILWSLISSARPLLKNLAERK